MEDAGVVLKNTCLQTGLCVEGRVVLKEAESSNRAVTGCKAS